MRYTRSLFGRQQSYFFFLFINNYYEFNKHLKSCSIAHIQNHLYIFVTCTIVDIPIYCIVEPINLDLTKLYVILQVSEFFVCISYR